MFEKMLSMFGLTQAQRQEIRHEIDLFEAMQAHANWKKRLMDYLEGNSTEDLQPHNICVDNRCALGIWIHGHGKKRFGEYQLFQQLVDEHAKFHFHASKVVEAHQAGDSQLAHKILSESFIEQSRKTVNCLAKLNAEIEAERPPA
ncbi:MAG: CZB domain-containing protein [Nitrosomonadales bacterium]|nr:CZB domain-containing protein [Nitrosomonadales bacterium]